MQQKNMNLNLTSTIKSTGSKTSIAGRLDRDSAPVDVRNTDSILRRHSTISSSSNSSSSSISNSSSISISNSRPTVAVAAVAIRMKKSDAGIEVDIKYPSI
jgi:hypothetical protein